MKLPEKFKLRNFLWLTLAGVINAIGVTMFIAPVNLYDSGISGTSILLDQITPNAWNLSLFLLILNIPLFLYGLKKQGKTFTVYAIYTVFIYSASAFIINDILPIDVSSVSPFAKDDLLLCSIFGGLISGIGSGLAIRYGGAMDGIEVMAVIFSKRLGITVGEFVMAYNVILYIAAGIIMKSWVIPLYSIVTYAVGLKAVDFIVEGLDRSKAAMIVTEKPDEVCAELSSMFETGVTVIEAKGGYSNKPKTMIYFVVNRFQIRKMQQAVHEVDPLAYITISEVADIYSANH
ncbi:MAG: YitT family protein [Clostridia bacterium]|nr:YitT family protein [Clostridia bacterium]